jgi:hypothetical protein
LSPDGQKNLFVAHHDEVHTKIVPIIFKPTVTIRDLVSTSGQEKLFSFFGGVFQAFAQRGL